MPEQISAILGILAVLGTIGVFARVLWGRLRDKAAPVRTEKAQIVERFVADGFSRVCSPLAKRPQYYVVFFNGKKKRAFRVSEFTYGSYRVGRRGTLKYQGSRLLDFS